VIANNGNNGIDTINSGTTFALTVQGNYIGTDITGTQKMGNAHYGLLICAPTDVLIGRTAPAARNVISNNGGNGINTFSNGQVLTIQGNNIGTDVTGP